MRNHPQKQPRSFAAALLTGIGIGTGLGVSAGLAFAATALATDAVAQVASPSTTPAQGANRPADIIGDGRQQATDAATTAAIKSALALDPDLKTQTILIETIGGTARLTGQVQSSANFDRAKDLVGRVDGVRTVENMLVVREVRPQ